MMINNSKQFHVILLILMTSIALFGGDQTELKSIAVLEFEGKGVSATEASTLTDRFRSELVQTKKFVQIERNRIEQIFSEQKLQMAGMVSDEKLVEIGELLGAELLVVGSIGKLGNTFTIDLRLVEVESGEIIASYFKDHRGEVDGLLEQFKIIASEIAGKEYVPSTSGLSSLPAQNSLKNSNIIQTELSIKMKAKADAAEDYSKFAWGAGGTAAGTTGGCLLGAIGGLFGIGATVGAGYLMDASPPQERLDALNTTDPAVQQMYVHAYEEALKKNRSQWGGGGSTLGCCVGITMAVMLLSSVESE